MDIIKLRMDKEHFDFITPYRAKFNKKANDLGAVFISQEYNRKNFRRVKFNDDDEKTHLLDSVRALMRSVFGFDDTTSEDEFIESVDVHFTSEFNGKTKDSLYVLGQQIARYHDDEVKYENEAQIVDGSDIGYDEDEEHLIISAGTTIRVYHVPKLAISQRLDLPRTAEILGVYNASTDLEAAIDLVKRVEALEQQVAVLTEWVQKHSGNYRNAGRKRSVTKDIDPKEVYLKHKDGTNWNELAAEYKVSRSTIRRLGAEGAKLKGKSIFD